MTMSESLRAGEKLFNEALGTASNLAQPMTDLAHSARKLAGRHPLAVTLLGAGIVWLVIDQRRRTGSTDPWDGARARVLSGNDTWEDDVPQMDFLRGPRPDERDRYWYDCYSEVGSRAENRYDEDRQGIITSGPDIEAADGAAPGLVGSVHGAVSAFGHAVTGTADSLGHAAADLTARLTHGLEDLSEDARSRVLAARRAAHEARLSAQAALDRGARATSSLYDTQPLAFAALALASGAVLGALLPGSRVEDATMGHRSDQLFAEAQSVLRAEREKATDMLKTVAKDVKAEFSDMGAAVARRVENGASSGADSDNRLTLRAPVKPAQAGADPFTA